jgi:hypothetical protein
VLATAIFLPSIGVQMASKPRSATAAQYLIAMEESNVEARFDQFKDRTTSEAITV